MKSTYFFNPAIPAHGVDITTDTGERFGIACPDEPTARTIAAGGEAIRFLQRLRHNYPLSKMADEIETFLDRLDLC